MSLFEAFASAVPVRRLNEALLIQWRDRIEGEFPRWTRNTVNRTVAHALRMLAWGRQRQLVPKEVWADCALVEPLERGACANRPERARPRRAVSAADVEKVAQHCHPQVAAMMRLQLSTSMRPGDVCGMRWADIDKYGPNGTWTYTVNGAKTEHHGYVTRYLLGTAKGVSSSFKLWAATPGVKGQKHDDTTKLRAIQLPPRAEPNGWTLEPYRGGWDCIVRALAS